MEDIEDSKSIKCRFTVLCARKNIPYELEAPDAKTKNEWVSAVQKCIGWYRSNLLKLIDIEISAQYSIEHIIFIELIKIHYYSTLLPNSR